MRYLISLLTFVFSLGVLFAQNINVSATGGSNELNDLYSSDLLAGKANQVVYVFEISANEFNGTPNTDSIYFNEFSPSASLTGVFSPSDIESLRLYAGNPKKPISERTFLDSAFLDQSKRFSFQGFSFPISLNGKSNYFYIVADVAANAQEGNTFAMPWFGSNQTSFYADNYNLIYGYSGGGGKTMTIRKKGAALDFDSSYVLVPKSLPATKEFSIQTWVNLRDSVNSKILSTSAYDLSIVNNKLQFRESTTAKTYSDTSYIHTNKWVHVSLTSDGNTVQFYINGILKYASQTSIALNAVSSFVLGVDIETKQKNFFNGQLDEFRFWSKALTATEINTNYACEIYPYYKNLELYYDFNQGIGSGDNKTDSLLIDRTTAKRNGQLLGFKLVKEKLFSNWISQGGVTSDEKCKINGNPEIYFPALSDLNFGDQPLVLEALASSFEPLDYFFSDSTLVYVKNVNHVKSLVPLKTGKLKITAQNSANTVRASQEIVVTVPPFAILGKKNVEGESEEAYRLSPVIKQANLKWTYKTKTGKSALFIGEDNTNPIALYYRNVVSEGTLRCGLSVPGYDTILYIETPIFVKLKENVLPKPTCDSLLNTDLACSGNFIESFKFEKIEALETGCSNAGYSDFTKSGFTTNLNLGSNYNATVYIGNNNPSTNSKNYVGVWVDYDNNGSFDDPNEFLYSTYTSESVVQLKNILLSSNFNFAGDHRLRIKVNSTGVFMDGGCLNYNESGETEDYKITLLPAERLEAPVLITPNNDGKNDFFIIKGIKINEPNKLIVFNRAGDIVYVKENYINTWDGVGKDQNQLVPDTYYYSFKNGSATISGYFELRY